MGADGRESLDHHALNWRDILFVEDVMVVRVKFKSCLGKRLFQGTRELRMLN